jgi:hypothetical protein
MDNLSEYIPLIIIIGSIVYSIIKGGVKKKLEETAKTTLPGKTSEETVWPENEIPPKAAVKKHVKKQKLPTPTLTVKGEQKKTIKTTSVVSNA